MTPQVVKAFIVTAMFAVFTADLFLLIAWGPKYTISWVVRDWSRDFPMLPFIIAFCMGALMYHLIEAGHN